MDNSALKILKDTHLFNGIPDEDILTMPFGWRSFSKNEFILNEEDTLDYILILIEGKVLTEKIYVDGDSDLLSVLEPGDMAGLDVIFSTFKKMPYAIISDSASTFITISVSTMMSSPWKETLLENIVQILADKNIQDMYRIKTLSNHGMRERILTHLKIMRQKRGTEIFDITMTQQQLAHYLCVNRSALSHELNNMRREGIIDFSRNFFRILK